MTKKRRRGGNGNGGRATFRKLVPSRTRFEHAREPTSLPLTEYYNVDYSIEGVVAELRKLDLDVGADNLSDIKIVSVGRVFETERVRDLDKVRDMATQMLAGNRFLPIVVSEDSHSVVDGHHRLIASIYAGWKYIPVRVLMPVRTMVEWHDEDE